MKKLLLLFIVLSAFGGQVRAQGIGGQNEICVTNPTFTANYNRLCMYATSTSVGFSATSFGSATNSGIAFPGIITLSPTLAANTSGDGLVLSDLVSATSGNQQYSPRVRWTGEGWKTNATAASQEVDFIAELHPAQGAANPDASLVFNARVNGGTYGPHGFSMYSSFNGLGNIFFIDSPTGVSSQVELQINGVEQGTLFATASAMIVGSITNIPLEFYGDSTNQMDWGSTNSGAWTANSNFYFGALAITNGYLIASLPSTCAAGARAHVTNGPASAPTFGSAPSATSTGVWPVMCTGNAWVYG